MTFRFVFFVSLMLFVSPSVRAARVAVAAPALSGIVACRAIDVSTGKTVRPQKTSLPGDGNSLAVAGIAIAPHRAVYKMSMTSAKSRSNISGVTGQMKFEWLSDCAHDTPGWTVQQDLLLHFSYAEGDEADVNSRVASWESASGGMYSFNVRRMTNGKETERFRGRATLGAGGGKANYTAPKDKETALPDGTIFPSAHTKLILEQAQEGEKFFTRRVFDGSDEEGMADISAFIGPQNDKLRMDDLPPAVRNSPLLAQPAWPVRLAFFNPDTETGEPDYEMDLVLQANGIARSMLIDYGDFSVSGVLDSLEDMSSTGCNQ